MFVTGGGGGGVACMSILRHSYRDFVILETKIFVILRSHREQNGVYFLIICEV